MAIFNGSNLRDRLSGTSLADQLFGNGGDDLLRGGSGDDLIRAGSGFDILEGGAGNDRLFADVGSSSLFGGEGSDILVSGTGSDLLNGGNGIDLASYEQANGRVVLNLTTGRGLHGDSVDALVGIENLLGSDFNDALSGDAAANDLYGGGGADNVNGLGGNDRVYGQDGDDLIFGQSGNDVLEGGAGNDTLDGGEGINVLRGGSGVDTVDYGYLGAGIEVDLAFRGTNMSGNGRFESLAEIEVIRATNSRDTLVGDAFGNQFFGRAGNDMIDGGEGDDILSGGAGADVFYFGAAPAHFLPAVDSGFDRITDYTRSEGDLIHLRSHHEATDFAALRADARQIGADTLIRLGEDAIVIEDMSVTELSAAMFLF